MQAVAPRPAARRYSAPNTETMLSRLRAKNTYSTATVRDEASHLHTMVESVIIDAKASSYPFRYNQPHDRVTYEDAPVTLLEPDHFLCHQPNPIRLADWEGWAIERGLYFFGEWVERYQPLLACNDPDESLKRGGLLVASYGRGTYVYAAYSFFRQLPAGE